MIKKVLLFIICISFICNSFAKVDYIRVMFNHNGANQATIGWNQVSGTNPVVYFGTEDILPKDYKTFKLNQKPNVSNTFKGMNNQFVRLQSLLPNTAYYFVVTSSASHSYRTFFTSS